MKRLVLVIAAITFAGAALIAGVGRAQESAKVRAEGCVEPGVEAGWLMVKAVKNGKLFNVMIKKPRPEIGAGIEFTGVLHEGPATCMQGVAVDVTTWARKDSLKSTKDEASSAAKDK